MGYRTLRDCLRDLERTGQLIRIEQEIDPHLEAAEIQRRVYAAGGPAIHFANVKGCRFEMVSNLFGTIDRTRFLFRDALEGVKQLVRLKLDPGQFFRSPWKFRWAIRPAWAMRAKRVRRGPILRHQCTVSDLPQLVSWPEDGGPFVTLPQVYTEHPDSPGFKRANLGMYRVQLAGNDYEGDREVGLHYQIHRSIGVHHAAAIARGEPLRVAVFIGGPPAMTLAAVMPLPEGLSELMFAGALGKRRVRMIRQPNGLPVAAEADFAIVGTVDPHATRAEGPFGDHLGYYSLRHEFPVLRVDHVFHRENPVWPFTVVGRPPQEDTAFGEIIHEISGPAIPEVLPGVEAVHAVDAAGVHPLLLAIGSERYVPYANEREPLELLTCANAILGQGQLSLAKYLLIAAKEDRPPAIHEIAAFFAHVLERVDWSRDLHFQTRTTIDTLDYSGTGLNQGSKLIIAAAGLKKRELSGDIPSHLHLPSGFGDPRVAFPGVMTIRAPQWNPPAETEYETHLMAFCEALSRQDVSGFPLVVLVDDSEFASRTLNNFLWVTFTRSNPADDVLGVNAKVSRKHFETSGPLVIDARIKTHHAPPLIEDPKVTARVDALAAAGGPLHGIV